MKEGITGQGLWDYGIIPYKKFDIAATPDRPNTTAEQHLDM